MFFFFLNGTSLADETFHFYHGANFFNYPVSVSENYRAYDFLDDLNDSASVSSIQRYNRDTGEFETCFWNEGGPAGVNFTITNTEGYIVNVEGDSFDFAFTGTRACDTVDLKKGFNLAIFPCAPADYSSFQLMENLGIEYISSIKIYDNSTDTMLETYWDGGNPSGDNFPIVHDFCYIVKMTADSTWSPPALPSVPCNLAAYPGNNLIILTWDDEAPGVRGFNIYRSTTQGSGYAKINHFLLSDNSFTDSDVENGVTYYYRVTSVNNYGQESEYSTEVNATPAYAGSTTVDSDITTDTIWLLSHSPYIVTTSIEVSSGTSLTIEPGVEVRFDTGSFDIRGNLIAEGTHSNPVIFKSNNQTPALGDWSGLRFLGSESGTSRLLHCVIQHASTGIYCEDSSPEIASCRILGDTDSSNFESFGIRLLRANPHIHHCTIAHFNNTSWYKDRAIYMRESSPIIEYNHLYDNEYGIEMYYGGNPQILHNIIEDTRKVGIVCDGEYKGFSAPFPTINYNTIRTAFDTTDTFNMSVYRYNTNTYQTNAALVIDARYNYWGTTSPEKIAALIYQWPNYYDSTPFVDFRGFLDSPNGYPVPGHYIPAGKLPSDELHWTPAAGPYIILGHTFVEQDQTLVIDPGTEIRFIGNKVVIGDQDRWVRSSLRINGKLVAQGLINNKIVFTSNEVPPAQGDWDSIIFYDQSDDSSIISYCKIEYAFNGIWCIGSSPVITHNEILCVPGYHYHDVFYGIRLENGSNALVQHNQISGFHNTYNTVTFGGIAIRILNSSPDISMNSIEECSTGIQIIGDYYASTNPSPNITYNSITNYHLYSFFINGNNNDDRNPIPVINHNNFSSQYITNNTFYTAQYGISSTIAIDATNNWWGTTDPRKLTDIIFDWNDTNYAAVVDYRYFLDSPDGNPFPGTQIHSGVLTGSDLHWKSENSPYLIFGGVRVAPGTTLKIDPGTEIQFVGLLSGNSAIEVYGTLDAQGTDTHQIKFTSYGAEPSLGDWAGIKFIGSESSDSKLVYGLIEYAKTGIYCEDSSPEIANCKIVGENNTGNFDSYGIYLLRSNSHIHHCTIAHYNNTSWYTERAIYMRESSPLVEYNHLYDNEYGIEIYYGGYPQILHNVIEDFTKIGIKCNGEYRGSSAPFPTINYNTIRTVYDTVDTYYLYVSRYNNNMNDTNASLVIDATYNYWGTSSPERIAALIYQWPNYNAASPFVDFRKFLDAPGGNPVPGHYIPAGKLPSDELHWTPDNGPYVVLGQTFVENDQTLTIDPGTEIRFIGGKVVVGDQDRWVRSSLRINGKLVAQGDENNKILFTSHEESPAQGDWDSIIFNDSADDNSIVSYSRIEYAYNGIWCRGASPTISHNEIACIPGNHYYDVFYGVRLESGADGLVEHNIISGFYNTYSDYYHQYAGVGIRIYNSSPTITNNTIDENSTGIWIGSDSHATGQPTPQITYNSIVNSHLYSFFINGYQYDDNLSPKPDINNNNIFSDHVVANSFYTQDYGTSNMIEIDATKNWWGTSDKEEIESIIRDKSDNSYCPTVKSSNYLNSDIGAFTIYGATLSNDYFSPNGDGEKDSAVINAKATESATWQIEVKDSSGTTVRTVSGTGAELDWTWDGTNDSNTLCADGTYFIYVTSTSGTNSITRKFTTHIDNSSIDTLNIDYPTNGGTYSGILDVRCTVNDSNIVSYKLELGAGSSPSQWRTLASGSCNISNMILYHWITNDATTDDIPTDHYITFNNGPYSLRLSATDKAGNTSQETVVLNLDNLFITGVNRTGSTIDPSNSETSSISFNINKPATIHLKIYPEKDGESGELIQDISRTYTTSGTKTISWNGKDSSGEIVPNEAYIYIIEANNGTLSDKYSPPRSTDSGWGMGEVPADYNFYTNDFWKMDYTMAENFPAGRVSMEVTPPGEVTFKVIDGEPHEPGETFTVIWDGRRPNGTLVEAACNIYFPAPVRLYPNYIIVKSPSSKPVISGQGPYIEVKADPYLVNFSYGEYIKLLYNIDRDAVVTIKVLPPGVTDSESPSALTVVDHENQTAGDPTVTWDGIIEGDSNNIFLKQEGVYTFVIEATNAGKTSEWKGFLNLYR